jgi:tetratricopeptide (TPR) repeat protein
MSFARNYDWADMKSLLEKAVIASPFNARAKVNLAQTYRHLGEHGKAIEILEALCELAPDYTNGLLALGRCYEEVGRYQSAIESYEKVLKTNPNSLQALNSLGNLYFRKRITTVHRCTSNSGKKI